MSIRDLIYVFLGLIFQVVGVMGEFAVLTGDCLCKVGDFGPWL